MKNSEKGEDTLKETVEVARKEKQVALIKALFDGLCELDESSRAIVLRKVGAACAQGVRALRKKIGVEYPTSCVDLDTACEVTARAALFYEPFKRDFTCKRHGDMVEIRDPICDVVGGCGCTLVTAGFIEPNDNLCTFCQEGYWMDHFEYLTGQRAERCEFPESHTMGGHYCVAQCYFKPAK